jgi:calcineurin-like phosphoesterase family protein
MSNIWLISDTHFNHANIINFKDRITGELVRGQFSSVDDMNQCMLDKWNETVKDGDTVIHCGDVLFGENKVDWLQANFAKLPGKKRLVLGNHDNVKFLAPFFKDIQLWIELPGIICTHTPLHISTMNESHRWGDDGPGINAHGHIHSNPSPEGPYKCVCVEQTNFAPINIDEVKV